MRRFLLLLPAALACSSPAPDAPVEAVFLPSGLSFGQMTDSLTAHGIVTKRRLFTWLARLGRYDRRLKAGYYEIRRGESELAVLKLLAAGSEKTFRLTIPEGFTILEIAAAAEASLGIPADSVRRAAADPTLMAEFGVDGGSMEGFLLPETYFVSRLITARGLVREMAEAFRRGWDSSWDARGKERGLSRRDLVTLASIVEGEAKVDEDRALVAAVYLNRLRLGMPLQADPTVQYAIQQATGQRKKRLFERDYRFPSEFNTYLRAGLPPSPVGAPSLKSIEAVLAPAPVPYLFFVAGLDGKHVFTRTYGEHLRAIARIRAAERQARRERGE
ncbi:MAG: endolytic transglycosylase MltG [Gemmatimonadetes bacterium]|nr:endolytic transglycosylase MltG [Gemmatimonadota bacterium]